MRPGPGLVVMALAFISGARRGSTSTSSTTPSSSIDSTITAKTTIIIPTTTTSYHTSSTQISSLPSSESTTTQKTKTKSKTQTTTTTATDSNYFRDSSLFFHTFLSGQTSLPDHYQHPQPQRQNGHEHSAYPKTHDFNYFNYTRFPPPSTNPRYIFQLPEHLRLHYDDPRGRSELQTSAVKQRHARSIESAQTDDRASDIVGRAGGTDNVNSVESIPNTNPDADADADDVEEVENNSASVGTSAGRSEGLLVQFPSKSIDNSRSFDEDDIFALVAEDDLLSEESFDRLVKLADDDDKIGYINEDDYSGAAGGVEGVGLSVSVEGARNANTGSEGNGNGYSNNNVQSAVDGNGDGNGNDNGETVNAVGDEKKFATLVSKVGEQQDDASRLIDESVIIDDQSSGSKRIINEYDNGNAATGNIIYAEKLIGNVGEPSVAAQRSVVETTNDASVENPTAKTVSKRKDLRRSIFETASPLARLNPWISACDLAQPGTATDLQGQCSAGTLPMAWVDEGPGPPTCPNSCEQLRLINKHKQTNNLNNNNNNKNNNLINSFDNKNKYYIATNTFNDKSNNRLSNNINYNNNNNNNNYMDNRNNNNINNINNKLNKIMTKVRRDVYEHNNDDKNNNNNIDNVGRARTPMMTRTANAYDDVRATTAAIKTKTTRTAADADADAATIGIVTGNVQKNQKTISSTTTKTTTATRIPNKTSQSYIITSAAATTVTTATTATTTAAARPTTATATELTTATSTSGGEGAAASGAATAEAEESIEFEPATTTETEVSTADTTTATPELTVNEIMQQDAEAPAINRHSYDSNSNSNSNNNNINIDKVTSENSVTHHNNYNNYNLNNNDINDNNDNDDLKYNYLRHEQNFNNNKYQNGADNGQTDATDANVDEQQQQQQCLDYLGDTAETSPTHLCNLKSPSELVARLRGLRLRHCCERNVFSALHTLALNATLAGGDDCVHILNDIMEVDTLASRITCELAEILFRFDCRQVYSLINQCDDCKEAYRRWVCSTLVPYFAEPSDLVLPPVTAAYTANDGSDSSSSSSSNAAQSPPINSHSREDNNSKLVQEHKSLKIISNNNKSKKYAYYERNKRSKRQLAQDSNTLASIFYNVIGYKPENVGIDAIVSAPAAMATTATVKRKRESEAVDCIAKRTYYEQQEQHEQQHEHEQQQEQQSNNFISTANKEVPCTEDLNVITNHLKRSKRKAEYRKRLRIRPCLSVCQVVEQKCPYLLPADRAPALPTQYAGEPTFLCLDQNILETGEQLRRSTYGSDDCCYRYCGAPAHGICAYCDAFVVPLDQFNAAYGAAQHNNSTRRVHNITLTMSPKDRHGDNTSARAASIAIALKNNTNEPSAFERLPFYAFYDGNYFYDEDSDDMPDEPLSGNCDVVPSVTSRCTIPYYASAAGKPLCTVLNAQQLLLWLSTLLCLLTSCNAMHQLRLRLRLGLADGKVSSSSATATMMVTSSALVERQQLSQRTKTSPRKNTITTKTTTTTATYNSETLFDSFVSSAVGEKHRKHGKHVAASKHKCSRTTVCVCCSEHKFKYKKKTVNESKQNKKITVQKRIINNNNNNNKKNSAVHFSSSNLKLNRRRNRSIFNYRICNVNLTTIKNTYSSNSCNNRNYRYFYYYNYNINDWWRRWWKMRLTWAQIHEYSHSARKTVLYKMRIQT